MQKAEWNSQLIYAFDVEKGSERWKRVRYASENGELRCPDPNCQNRTLIYRCGDQRIPHFAHRAKCNCDYAQFDKKNSESIYKFQQKLYDKFCKLNFTVFPDEKIGNYYVHLIICSDINEKIAIRIVDENLPSISEIESIYQVCENENIKLQWIAIDDPQQSILLEQTHAIKRYVLDERGDDWLITDKSFSIISQYKCNKPVSTEIFKDTAPFDELTIESGHLSLPGFSQKYHQQLIDKQKALREQKEWGQKAKREDDTASWKNAKWPTTSQNISPVNIEPPTMKPTGTSFCPDTSLPLPQRYLAAKAALFERAFSSLNPRQQEAVFHVNGPLLVLAGAGSGKTTVLVRRVAFLIRYGNAYHSERLPDPLTEERVSQMEAAVSLSPEELFPLLDEFADDPCPPWRVLAITFTNKAANEIKSRLAAMFPQNPDCAAEIWTGTFHSVCVRILRRHGEACGYRPGFSIYDADDSKKAFSEAMKRAGVDEKVLPLKTVANAVSRAKDRLLTPEEYEAEAGRDYRLAQIARVYTAYQQLLRESNALDFDDLIMQTVLLLQREPSVVEEYQRRFRYVCVDEYQDTNPAQFALTRLLSGGSRNIMVVGDDDQSIYRFRGATIENILSFDKAYPGAAVVRLEQNYRSTQNILDAANNVILQNAGRMGKTLWTAAGEGAPIHLIDCDDQNDEGRRIVDVIQRMVARGEASYRDFAVLYRVNAQSQSLEKAFARAAVPYRMLGGLRFNDRKEIRDAAAYLQLIANHNDNMRLLRIINEPRRKIGPRTLEAIALIAQEQDCSMFAVIERAADFVALKNARPMLEDFARLIHTLTDDLERLPLDVFFDAVLDRSGYRRMLAEAGESEADRLDNLEEFKSQIIDYMKNAEEPTLAGFLEETALVADVDRYDESADAVVMMTVHSAKGLEFPVVFLPGMEEGVFPGMQTIEGGQAEMEEERRLCYVAITRAKRELYILHTAQRLLYGRTCCNPISRFVSEIPDTLLQKQKRPRPSAGFYGRVTGDWEDSEYTEDDWLGAPSTYPSPAGSRGGKGAFAGRSVYGSRGAAPAPGQPRIYYSESESGARQDAAGSRVRGASASGAAQRSGGGSGRLAPAKERFAPGDRVRHPVFGEGEVLSVRQLGADTLYEVMFDTAGTKKLMASYAKLRRA